MIKLHLVGFTSDLKNLIFSRRKGAKSGTFVVAIDPRLRRTLEEVARLETEASGKPAAPAEEEQAPPGQRRSSQLTPKEIQAQLRKGRSIAEVAREADTDPSWIERFVSPIVAERSRIVDAVKVGWISKARLGRSAHRVGDAIEANLRDKRVSLPPEILDEGWDAVQRDKDWKVTFRYLSRGQHKEASFEFDPETREVKPMNDLARELAWRGPEEAQGEPAPTPRRTSQRSGSSRRKSTRSRTVGSRRPTPQSKRKGRPRTGR